MTPEENYSRVYFMDEGVVYSAQDIGGSDLCALFAVIAVAISAAGISHTEIDVAVNGELTEDMKAFVQDLRYAIVSSLDTLGDDIAFEEGNDPAAFTDVVQNPMHVIMRRDMWEKVTLCPSGCLDGRAAWLAARILGLDGFRIVRDEEVVLVPCDAEG